MGITYRQFGELVGHQLARRRQAEDGAGDVVAEGLGDVAFHDGERGEPAGVFKNLPTDGAALEAVASKQWLRLGQAVMNESDFPREVARVLHAGVHALSAGGTVDVRRIAGEKHS